MTACANPTDATAALLVEQVRASVQTEETRFARAQSRAAALLAATGVIAGLGGGVLAGSNGKGLARIGVPEAPFVHWLAVVFALISVGSLLGSAAMAIGALKKAPEPKYGVGELDRFVKIEAPLMVSKTPLRAAAPVFALLAKQLHAIQIAGEEVDRAFDRAIRLLGIGVGCGLMLWSLTLLSGSESHSRARSVDNEPSEPMQTTGFATLRIR